MLRPQSIVRFDRIYLAGIILSLAYSIASFGRNRAAITADPEMARLGFNNLMLVGVMALSVGLSLLLWYFITRRASNFAKWVLVVLTAGSAAMLPFTLANPLLGMVQLIATVGFLLLQLIAVSFLFRKDARDWLKSKGRSGATDPAIFG